MSREVERRHVTVPIELREVAGKKVLSGYAALYNSLSEDLGGFVERIMPGAFDRALKEGQEVIARAEHDTRLLLGRRSNGTLRLSTDGKGLKYEVDIPDTQAGRDVAVLVARGDVRGSSFAFSIPDPQKGQRWTTEENQPLRELIDLDLVDVATTALPAYPETSVSARALEHAAEMRREAAADGLRAVLLGEADDEAKRRATWRVLARVTQEQREASWEDRIDALYVALAQKLGDRWIEGNWWTIEAMFDDRVIVERFEGIAKYYQYPVTYEADGAPVLGEPVEVEVNYTPVGGGGARSEEEPEDDFEGKAEIEKLRREIGA